MGDEPRLMGVRTEVLLETLVGELHQTAAGRASSEDVPDAVLAAADDVRAQTIAKLGYWARAAETDRFPAARGELPWLERELAARGGDVAATCAELAAREPRRRPDPADDPPAVGWLVPGPGGHVRHFLAMRAADTVIGDDTDRPPVAMVKRWWTHGFLVRCCEPDSHQFESHHSG